MEKEHLNKFYKKSHEEKIEALRDAQVISVEDFNALKNNLLNLPADVANQMIENYIMNYAFPFGVALNFVIDGKEHIIPMVTEEPSVVAAASNAGKIVARSGGFVTNMNERLMIAQIALKDVPDVMEAEKIIKEH